MKRLPPVYAAILLLAPLLIIGTLATLPVGCGSSSTGVPTPLATTGYVEIGFIDSPSAGYQSIGLNVTRVRLNPSTDPQVAESDLNWVIVPAAAATGSVAEVQVDLTQIENQTKLFASAQIAAQTYRQIEVQLDPNVTGTLIPNCTQGALPEEGCINYTLTIPSPIPTTGVTSNANLRTTSAVAVTANGLTPLVIDIDPGLIVPPAAPGGSYQLVPTVSVVSPNVLSLITGNVGVTTTAASAIYVTAEETGTSVFVAQSPVLDNGAYNLLLPASTNGSTYDLVVGGGLSTAQGFSGLTLIRGSAPTTVNFTIAGTSTQGVISGNLFDQRTTLPIQGATVNVLAEPINNPGAQCISTPASCVAIANTTTNNLGLYSLPSITFGNYYIEAMAPGYTTIVTPVTINTATTNLCQGTTTTTNCTLNMVSNQISGTVVIDSPPPLGASTQVLILAEDTGTSNLENVVATNIPSGTVSAQFTLNVPTNVAGFDLIATTEDLYLGVPSPYPGHTIAVASNVPGSSSGVMLGGQPGASANPGLNCVGHGTIIGVANNSDAGTAIRLYKGSVQLQQTGTAPEQTGAGVSNPNANQFSFCVPPDIYTLQRWEGATPTASPVGTPTNVIVPTPVATSSACPSTCGNSFTCPGICGATTMNPL